MSFTTPRRPSSFTFPIYLLPNLPFHRSKRRTQTNTCLQAPTPAEPVPEPYLDGNISRLRCAHCAADLCLSSQIISKGFTGRLGRAYLVSPSPSPYSSSAPPPSSTLPNTKTHPPVSRQLVTGAHTVSDVSCTFCSTVLGWKYEGAEEETQRYKVGKFILETREIRVDSVWEGGSWGGDTRRKEGGGGAQEEEEEEDVVEFDSQDEDECEDLFAGVWSPKLARRRREGRRFGRGIAGPSKGAR